VVAKISSRAKSVEMVMTLGFAKPLVVWNGGLRTTGRAVACVGCVGRAFSPEGLRETGVNEICPDQVENG
jgi:hypothetical protein